MLFLISDVFAITFFVGKVDPNQRFPFELTPKPDFTYQDKVWWLKHRMFLYKPRIIQTADLWPIGRPDGVINLFDYAVFAQSWLTEKEL